MTTKLFRFLQELSQLPNATHWKTQSDTAKQIVKLMGKPIHYKNRVSIFKNYY